LYSNAQFLASTPSNEENFCQTFMRLISKALRFTAESKEYRDLYKFGIYDGELLVIVRPSEPSWACE